jgi:hypothetical protein
MTMTALDRFTSKLHCPNCHKEGVARLSQLDGYAYMRDRRTTVEETPAGFRYERNKADSDVVDFYCADCNTIASAT